VGSGGGSSAGIAAGVDGVVLAGDGDGRVDCGVGRTDRVRDSLVVEREVRRLIPLACAEVAAGARGVFGRVVDGFVGRDAR
jgi:hypothetical protein